MPPKVNKYFDAKKVSGFKSNSLIETIDISENAPSKLKCKQKNNCAELKLTHITNCNDEFDEMLSSPLKQNINLKPLSFWRKKLKELEPEELPKKAKCRLYEFSASEDSFSPNKKKKNRKIKGRVKKKKQQAEFKINYNIPTKTALRTKVKDFHKRLIAEVKDKENNKLVDNVKSKTKSSVIITSTPVPNKNGLTDMSNFLFSPIEKMQENDIITVNSKKQINNVSIAISTPKTLFRKTSKIEVEPNQDNCIRVLRSRKILLS